MSRRKLSKGITKTLSLPYCIVYKIVDKLLSAIADKLIAGTPVRLPGFGTFYVKELPARKGVNPRTKEKIDIPQRKVIKFKVSKLLKERL